MSDFVIGELGIRELPIKTSTRLECLAPAKINLALHVTGQRSDGYHLLDSLVCFTRFGDQLSIERADHDSLEITGPLSAHLRDQTPKGDNLLERALATMRTLHPIPPLKTVLEKHIPVAAGLGGGSSDAAAMIGLIAKLYPQIAAHADLPQLALGLGADVPMCLKSQPMIARGIGEELSVLPDFPELQMVLINPRIGVSTPEIFANLANKNNTPLPALPDVLNAASLVQWLHTTRNDLELPAIKTLPLIADIKNMLDHHGASLARMSGSGASVFGLFETKQQAQLAVEKIAKSKPDWFVIATQTLPSLSTKQDRP